MAAPPAAMTFALPGDAGAGVELELVKVDLVTSDFSVVTSGSGGKPVPYVHGVHYRGVVKGDAGSLAAVSIFADEVMAIARPSDGRALVLGRLEQRRDGAHVLYAEDALTAKMPFMCENTSDGREDPEEFESFLEAQQNATAPASDAALARCVRIYVETNTDLFLNKGSVSAVTNYVTGLFNQSAILYANDGIPVSLSQVYVWTTASPYTGSTSLAMLRQFQAYRNSFNGDLGQLLALRGGGGVADGYSGFCNSNTDARQCYSGINASYSNVPTYSWTVNVFTHELGHLMGSRHTHACVWNGNNTGIDGCSTLYEGSCYRPGLPAGGGTIMSYCYLTSVGTNLAKGFGPQPGNVIRTRFNNASCLQNCSGGGCSGTLYSGALSGAGAEQFQPNGSSYQSTTSGTHRGTLTGPAGTDFDLFTQKWDGSAWTGVAASESPTSVETITYSGTPGYYRWRAYSYSGSGNYNLCLSRPQ